MKRADPIEVLRRKLAEARAENRQLQATIRQRRGSVTRQHMALLAHLRAETERADRAEALVRSLAGPLTVSPATKQHAPVSEDEGKFVGTLSELEAWKEAEHQYLRTGRFPAQDRAA